MPPIDDPNRLDINLSLLPGESETAINALVTQLQGISNQLAMLKATDPGAAARAQLSMFEQTGMPLHGVSATASTPQGLRGGIDLDAHMRQAREEQEAKRQDQEQQRRQQSAMNAEERRREAVRKKQQDDMDRIQREKYAELVAQQKLHTTGLISGARHVLRGKRPKMGEDFTPEEQAEAYERIEPDVGLGRNLINRTLQVLSPDVEPVDRGVLRQQAARHAYEQVTQGAKGGEVLVKPPSGGQRSSGASAPVPATRLGDDGFSEPAHGPMAPISEGVDPNAPAWMRHVSQQGVYAPMTMPRIGEFTAQDTLNMMGQWLGRRAYDARTNAGTDASNTTGFFRGSASAGFMRMAATAPYLSNLAGNLSRRGFEVDHNQLESLAVLSGRGTIGETDSFGPFQVRSLKEQARNALQGALLEARFISAGMTSPYLKSGQAVNIGGQLIRAGFGEEEAMNALRGPIGNVRGETLNLLDPEEIVNVYQQSIRSGGEPLSEFTRALSDLPHAARAARMSVDEMNASNLQFAETVQSMGGTFLGGYNRANAWAAMTGTAPQVGETLAQNPLVQGMAFGATGLLPQLQGMMDQGTATNVGLNTLNMLVNTYAGGMSDRVQKVPGGVLRVSARDQAIALAGQQLGLDREVTERLLNNQEMAQAMGPIQGSIDAYLQDVEDVGVGRANRGAGQSGVSRRDITRALRGAGFEDLSSLKGKSGDKFATAIAEMQRKRWEDIYGEASKSDQPPNEAIDVEIRLKGPAAKYLEATMANQPANLGRMLRDKGYSPPSWTDGIVPERLGEWAGSFLGG